MEETAAIRDRLERIDVLARRGAGRSDLLSEVRGLLEEGERLVRAETAERVADGQPLAPSPKASAAAGAPVAGSASKEAAVSQ